MDLHEIFTEILICRQTILFLGMIGERTDLHGKKLKFVRTIIYLFNKVSMLTDRIKASKEIEKEILANIELNRFPQTAIFRVYTEKKLLPIIAQSRAFYFFLKTVISYLKSILRAVNIQIYNQSQKRLLPYDFLLIIGCDFSFHIVSCAKRMCTTKFELDRITTIGWFSQL